jgi:hypothetical protein
LPVPRLRALEAVSGEKLAVTPVAGGYRVTLPEFRSLAVLVVARTPSA